VGKRSSPVPLQYGNEQSRVPERGYEPKELTPEEQFAEEERLAKKRKKNENLRAWRAKKKKKEKAEKESA
jgi:hypothetical protein